MNFDEWVDYNWIALSHNYNSRNLTSTFDEFCNYIYAGIINGCWLPDEYLTGIKGVS